MTAWRAAGLTLVRRALKPEFRKAAEKRGETSVKITFWQDGKPNPAKTA